MTKHLSIQKVLAALLTIAAIATGQTVWADDVTLLEDNDFGTNEVGHWYVNMPTRTAVHLTLSADDLTTCGYTFKVYDDGGKDGNYSVNCSARLAITVPDGYAFLVTGTLWTQHSGEDYLRFIKGDDSYSYIGDKWYSSADGEPKTVGPVTCNNSVMSLLFKSATTGMQYSGLDLTVTVVDVNTDYTVSISNPTHGTLAVDKATAKLGETVTVTPTPDTDFSTTEVSYTAGTTKHVINPVNNVYSFTMPACDVSVGAVFMDAVMILWGGADVDGSEEHPYVISNKEGWDLLVTKSTDSDYTNGKYFELAANISGVTHSVRNFGGHLDGKGHTITLEMGMDGVGLIDLSYYGCTISNLTVKGSIENPAAIVGGFIARSAMIDNTITLTDCRSKVTITSNYTGSSTNHYSGSFVGKAINVECVRCVFDGAFVSSTTGGFSGLVGSCYQLFVTDCAVVFGSATSLTYQNGANFSFADCNNNNITEQGHNFYFNKGGTIFGGIQPRGGTPVYPLTLTEPAAAVRTDGTLIGDGSTTVYADGFNLDGTEYYAADATVTLSAPAGVSITAAQYNDGTNHAATINSDGTATFTMPAANTTATITGFAANYIDADGTEQTQAVSLLSSSDETVNKAGGWYAVTGEVTLSQGLTFSETAHLILTDGATLNVSFPNQLQEFRIAINATDLNVYGQTLGTGTLNANSRIVEGSSDYRYAYAIKATGNVTFCGGQINAEAIILKGSDTNCYGYGYGIYAEGCVNIIRGNIRAMAEQETDQVYAFLFNITADGVLLDWRCPTDRICLTVATKGAPKLSPVSVAEGKALWNGTEVLSGTISKDQFNGKTLQPCIAREVAGYGEDQDRTKWVFIASPVTGSITPTTVGNLVPKDVNGTPVLDSTDYDLYRFNQSAALEWENYKAHSTDFNLVNGQGYLYATKETKTLAFMGDAFNMGTEDVEVPLVYDEGKPLAGWNLVGNPFTVNAILSQPYYRMNESGTALSAQIEANNSVAAMEGVFVQATGNNQTVTFTAQTRGGEKAAIAQANIMVVGNNGAVIDNAIIRFDGGQTLEKFSFREGSTKIYIPQNGRDYAIAFSEGQGEMPLNFKAETDGTYTISVDVDNVNLAYLHLIDNMTGADVDLLAANGGDARHGDAINRVSTYTFEAKTTDYALRFRLVFSVGVPADGDNEAFAFIDASGNIIVNGEGTLQMVDVTGRFIVQGDAMKCKFDGVNRVSTAGMTPGVYVLRLIDGENVRTQKIVVE